MSFICAMTLGKWMGLYGMNFFALLDFRTIAQECKLVPNVFLSIRFQSMSLGITDFPTWGILGNEELRTTLEVLKRPSNIRLLGC